MKTVKLIEVQEWNKLVQDTYSKPYNFQQQDGCKDRGVAYFTVPNKNPYDYENDHITEVVNGNEMGVSFKAWLARDPQQPLNSPNKWDRDRGIPLFGLEVSTQV